jgi:lipid-A-disaccharide synthase-like uncharacterized protein
MSTFLDWLAWAIVIFAALVMVGACGLMMYFSMQEARREDVREFIWVAGVFGAIAAVIWAFSRVTA